MMCYCLLVTQQSANANPNQESRTYEEYEKACRTIRHEISTSASVNAYWVIERRTRTAFLRVDEGTNLRLHWQSQWWLQCKGRSIALFRGLVL